MNPYATPCENEGSAAHSTRPLRPFRDIAFLSTLAFFGLFLSNLETEPSTPTQETVFVIDSWSALLGGLVVTASLLGSLVCGVQFFFLWINYRRFGGAAVATAALFIATATAFVAIGTYQ